MKNLFNFILNFFGMANDWTLVWEDHGEWKVWLESGREDVRKSIYSIFFSPSLNKNKLKLSGYRPESHTVHLFAKVQLIKLNKDLMK